MKQPFQPLSIQPVILLLLAVEKPLPRPVRDGYLWPYRSWQSRIAVHRFVQEIPLRPSHPSYRTIVDVENGLGQFQRAPLLLIWGERDWCFTTAFLDEWEERFPRADVLQLPDAGHYVFEDAGEQILERLRHFLGT
jgi:haloalkane dehalogenase